MFVDRFILKNNQITISPCFSFIPKTGVGLPQKEVSFYCEWLEVQTTECYAMCNERVQNALKKTAKKLSILHKLLCYEVYIGNSLWEMLELRHLVCLH